MIEHGRKSHGWKKKLNATATMWRPCWVETFRAKNQGGYFVVEVDDAATNDNVNENENETDKDDRKYIGLANYIIVEDSSDSDHGTRRRTQLDTATTPALSAAHKSR